MPIQYRNMYVGEFIGWAKQHDLPYRLETILATSDNEQLKSLARIGLAFCNEDKIQTFEAARVLELATMATLAGVITSEEKDSLLTLIAFDPEEEKLKEIADHVVARQEEVANYQINIDNYTAMIALLDETLPAEWPTDLLAYRGKDLQQIYAAVPDDLVDTVVDLLHRDRLRMLLRSEKGEQRKANLVLSQLLTKLPSDRRDELVATARSKMQMARG